MIITEIIGGIGNQLFQYAAGRALAEHHKTELKLDLSAFDNYKLRNFDLSNFNLQFNVCTREETKSYLLNSISAKIINKVNPTVKKKFFKENFFHYNKQFECLGDDVYLKGYFQSEKYFKSIEYIIRKEFCLKPNVIESVKDIREELSGNNSISVHFRRGDYKNQKFNDYHGIISIQYYIDAIKFFNENTSDPVFYIFSDDINWVKSNISIPNSIILSGELTKNHFEDFYLMSQCKHNIIANSSFSWWTAWLNSNPGKMVIAPKKWFNKGPQDTQDLFPSGWIKID